MVKDGKMIALAHKQKNRYKTRNTGICCVAMMWTSSMSMLVLVLPRSVLAYRACGIFISCPSHSRRWLTVNDGRFVV